MIGLGLLAGGISSLTKGGQARRDARQERRVDRIAERNPTRAARVDSRMTGRNDFLDSVGDTVSGVYQDITGQTAIDDATAAQTAGNEAAQETLDPYAQAGTNSLGQMQALMGASGPEAQAAAYQAIQNSPGFMASVQQGENAMLQNASATGGLRGGNTQAAMAQFRPQMLNQAVQQQLQGLGGLAGMGMNATSQIAGLQSGAGDIAASNALAGYQGQRDFWGDIFGFGTDIAKMFAGGGGG